MLKKWQELSKTCEQRDCNIGMKLKIWLQLDMYRDMGCMTLFLWWLKKTSLKKKKVNLVNIPTTCSAFKGPTRLKKKILMDIYPNMMVKESQFEEATTIYIWNRFKEDFLQNENFFD